MEAAWMRLMGAETPSLLQLPHPQGQVRSQWLSSSSSSLLLSYQATRGSIESFPVVRDSCRVRLVCCENCCVCICTLDALVGGDVLHVQLLLWLLGPLCCF